MIELKNDSNLYNLSLLDEPELSLFNKDCLKLYEYNQSLQDKNIARALCRGLESKFLTDMDCPSEGSPNVIIE